jgi:hypothetical protein
VRQHRETLPCQLYRISPDPNKRDEDDQTVVIDFPAERELSKEERKAERVMSEAVQLAAQPAGAWKLWYADRAKRLRIEPSMLAELIEAQIEDAEKKAAEKTDPSQTGRAACRTAAQD